MSLRRNILILLITSIVPFMIGFNVSASISYKYLIQEIGMSSMRVEFFSAIYAVGLGIGALLGGIGVDIWNRRKQLLYISLITSVICILVQFFHSYEVLTIHRFILGVTFGFLTMSVQVQIVEIFIPKHRGKFFLIYVMFGTIGNLVYGILSVNEFISPFKNDLTYGLLQIPYIFLPLLVIPIIHLLPKYSPVKSDLKVGIKSLFKSNYRLILNSMIILSVVTVFSSATVYIFKTGRMIHELELHYLSLIIGLVSSVITIFLIDSVGRKKLLYIGSILLIIVTLSNIILFAIFDNQILLIIMVYLYVFLYSVTFASVTLLLLEYMPSNIRGRGMIIFNVIVWIPSVVYNMIYIKLFIHDNPNLSFASGIMSIVLLFGIFFFRRHLVETKCIPLEVVESSVVKQ